MKRLLVLPLFFLLPLLGYSQNSCPDTPSVVYEGKEYYTVQIGSQCWFKENLDVGTMIASSSEADSMSNNNIIEKYCYNNDLTNCTAYGGLYQWNEAMQYVITEKAKGICPTGWHIPTYAEFQTLEVEVSNNSNVLKAVGQGTGAGAGTNTSGFSALLAGLRGQNSVFDGLGINAGFWSSTATFDMALWYTHSLFSLNLYSSEYGYSIRCLKDEVTTINDHSNNSSIPGTLELFQNYPNPFNPSTVICYQVLGNSFITLTIYDMLGNEVTTLVNEVKPPGIYEVTFDAQQTTNHQLLTSGVYFYQLRSGSFVQTKKMIILK
ncbi:MAG: hypothetical protein COW85_10760 [Ignavibacteria bacterium CG22_combo_CG10-13_8_21_14_all_37_15]|nr:MAG: hypothetical protein COW85_10760 [Ignavibacteria bacterium CG22_combo_CG10-13_8_21_14_all_37_15]